MAAAGSFDHYEGQLIPKEYNAGYIALSYLVSLAGATSTLELMNRRTWFEGFSNQYELTFKLV